MVLQKQIKVQALTVFVLSIVVLAAVIIGHGTGLFQSLDNYLYDLHFKYRGTISNTQNVVLVLMDEKSSGELKRARGIWSRSHLSQALDNLCAAETEVIGLDMILSVPDIDPSVDPVLAEEIYQCNNVILGRVSSGKEGSQLNPLPRRNTW